MEFQTLKKSYKKQIVIGALAICVIGGALTFNLTRAKYKITEEIPLVRGNINYSVPDLRVVAIKTSEDGTNYTDVSDVPTSGYTLNTTNSICKLATTDAKDNNITIEYKDGKINFLGVGNKNTRCYLYFDKKDTDTVTVAFGNIEVKRTTPDFSQIATTDEGVYSLSDSAYGGTSYYWRGAVTNNHVIFANNCWRIVRINGDGSIRMIYNGNVQSSNTCLGNGSSTAKQLSDTSAYNEIKDHSYYVGWTYEADKQFPSTSINADGITIGGTSSNIKTAVESWYTTNISNKGYDGKVAIGIYRNDGNTNGGWVSQGSSFDYAPYIRLVKNKKPNILEGSIYNLKVGLITADEIAFAGGVYNVENVSYYLYSGDWYWTMSPCQWYSGTAYAFAVQDVGSLGDVSLKKIGGVRPVINLRSDVTFSGGDGTLNNPYVVR